MSTTVALLDELLGGIRTPGFAVRLWDGTTWQPEHAVTPIRFTLVLRHPGALRAMFLPPSELRFLEAYVYEDFDVEGDVESLLSMLETYSTENGNPRKLEQLRLGKRLLSLPPTDRRGPEHRAVRLRGRRHSKERDRQAISYHYDLPSEFYELFLDPHMLYTCAYFTTETEDLRSAQEGRLDYICRKLRLQPGERLLDVGCGWGGLLVYAAQHFGVDACGITISREQADYARKRISAAGLEGRCRVELVDYRDIKGAGGYDKITALGFLEHVGHAMLPSFFQQAWSLLRPGGVLLTQAIASAVEPFTPDDSNFYGRYVFPDGELVPISMTLQAAEESGFQVRDVENLRDHYPLTLRHWSRQLEDNAEKARELVGDTAYRIYRMYLSVSVLAFTRRRISVYQSLFSKPDDGGSGLPLTRADWYK
jgi:cyclopropane-fatty-acyl-phospholipid synthase